MRNNFVIPKYNGAGIYCIINIENCRVYVGQSKNIHRRAYAHKNDFINNNHNISDLTTAYNNNYLFFIILDKYNNIDNEMLLFMEKVYMLAFDDLGFDLYNDKCVNDNYYGRVGKPNYIQVNVLADILWMTGATDKVKKAINNRFNMSPANLLRTKYRLLYYVKTA